MPIGQQKMSGKELKWPTRISCRDKGGDKGVLLHLAAIWGGGEGNQRGGKKEKKRKLSL